MKSPNYMNKHVFLLVLLPFHGIANSDELPKWEVGIGAGYLNANSYRGSGEVSEYLVPLPYFAYRGDDLRINSNGLNAKFFSSEKVEIDLSIRGTIPVKSNETNARSGMPDLLPIIEIGPSVNWELYKTDDHRIRILAPVRAAIATDIRNTEFAGLVFSPNINFDMPQTYSDWDLGLTIGGTFASERYNDYFYGVDENYVTGTRPEYASSGGYAGLTTAVSAIWREPNYWIGLYLQYDNLSNAEFKNSPLVEREDYYLAGLAITWVFLKSKTSTGLKKVWR